MTAYRWIAGNGQWDVAANWDQDAVPNGSTADATLDGLGVYTVSIIGSDYVNSLTIDDPNATVMDAGMLQINEPSGLLNLAAGTLAVTGKLVGGTVALSGGSLELGASALLMDVTLGGVGATSATIDAGSFTGATALNLVLSDPNLTLVVNGALNTGLGFQPSSVLALNAGTLLLASQANGNNPTRSGMGELAGSIDIAGGTLAVGGNTLLYYVTFGGVGAFDVVINAGDVVQQTDLVLDDPNGTLTVLGGLVPAPLNSVLSLDAGTLYLGGFLEAGTVDIAGGTLDVSAHPASNPYIQTGAVVFDGVAVIGTISVNEASSVLLIEQEPTIDAPTVISVTGANSDVVYMNQALTGDTIDLDVPLASDNAGGTVLAAGTFTFDAHSRINVGGFGSIGGQTLISAGTISLSENGTASLAAALLVDYAASFTNTGTIALADSSASFGGATFGIVGAAHFVNDGLISIGVGARLVVSDGFGATRSNGAAFTNEGTITMASISPTHIGPGSAGAILPSFGGGVTVNAASGRIVGAGTIDGYIENDGTIEAQAPAIIFTTYVTGSGVLQIDANATLELQAGAQNAIQFDGLGVGSGASLWMYNASAPIGLLADIQSGDSIFFINQSVGSVSSAGTILTVSFASGGPYTYTLAAPVANLTETIVSNVYGANDGIEFEVACFLRGTAIATPSGERPVETLQPGDLVVTNSGEHRALRWIGFGRTLVTPSRRTRATPIVVRKGALADNIPHRDLYITQGHSLLIEGVLIPVEELVNHRSIAFADDTQIVEHYHLELDTHDVVIAEGAAAETFRDDGNSHLFQNVDTRPPIAAMPPCAPILHDHGALKRIWRRLSDRAGTPDFALTEEPDLHLRADGARIDAETTADRVWRFRLPAPVADLRIVSRSCLPAMIGRDQDQRRLGVALRRIVLAQAGLRQEIGWDYDGLSDGFHGQEPAEEHRWTDGAATIPAALLGALQAGAIVELHVNSLLPYPVDEVGAKRTQAA